MQTAMDALQRGDLDTAEPLFEAINRRWPQFAPGWHFHGLLLQLRGESERAIALLTRAHAIAPRDFVFLVNFATVLAEAGRTKDALDYYERARQLKPDDLQLLGKVTQLMLSLEQGDAMSKEIERRINGDGRNWELWALLGQCRQQGGSQTEAIEAFERALQHAPQDETEPLVLLGQCARRHALHTKAEKSFKAALKRQPDNPGALLGLGYLATDRGDFKGATRFYRKALALQPRLSPAWNALSTITPAEEAAALARELDEIIAAAKIPSDWYLYFARGRARERSGDYDGAFADYLAGNRPRVGGQMYSRKAQANYTRDIIEHLDRAFLQRQLDPAPPSPRPIFICGMHRSGTTLLETMLAAHPRIKAGGEMHYIHNRLRRHLGSNNLGRTGSWLAARLDNELNALARGWRHHMGEAAAGHDFITDKLPGNTTIIGLIKLCFPDAAVIHMRRDARDTCFSCFATPFEEGNLFASTLESVGHFYRLHEQLMAHWRNVLGSRQLIEVGYEQLVRDPDAEVSRIFSALDLEWDSGWREFHKLPRQASTASAWQVRQPLYSSSIGRWRNFKPHLTPLLDELARPTSL
jgi:tetratricopeptide (TPR) repeat protein